LIPCINTETGVRSRNPLPPGGFVLAGYMTYGRYYPLTWAVNRPIDRNI